MYVAILMNTFVGQCDPYGIFESEEKAWKWIEENGINIGDYALWSVQEVRSYLSHMSNAEA